MEGRRSFDGLNRSIITAVVREGPDVLVTFRNARLERRSLRKLRFIATMRFVDAHRINSVNCQNAAYPARLEPRWQVYMATFDDLSADLSVYFTHMHDMYFVSHRIWCDAVELKLRFDLRGSLKAYYFPASFCSVSREPTSSPPIEGQEGPMVFKGQEGPMVY